MDNTLSAWKLSWGGGWYVLLLVVAAVYLVAFHRDKKTVRILLGYMGVFLFVFFCPITAGIIQKCVGDEVYWRVLWILPTVPILAYAGTILVRSFRKRAVRWKLPAQIFSAVFVAAVFALCGKSVWSQDNYVKVANYQKVPDEVAQVCKIVREQTTAGETACLAADDYLAAYIRVYDSSIYMPYSRAGKGSLHYSSKRLYQELSSPEPNIRRVIKIAKRLGCNFLVFALPGQKQQNYLQKKGYELVGTVNQYGVFYCATLPANSG